MAEDFEKPPPAMNTGIPGGTGVGTVGGGFVRAGASYEERLQEMRKHLRAHQERHRRIERCRKARDRELATQWMQHVEEDREARDKEHQRQMDRLAAQKERARCIAERRDAEAAALAPVRADAVAAASGDVAVASVALPALMEDIECSEGRRTTFAGQATHRAELTQAGGAIAGPPDATARKAIRVRKKRHVASEETTSPALPRGPASSREKSIVQQAQERFQGLNWSADGREILANGTRTQRRTREALVKGDPSAVERAEKDVAESGEEEQEAEVQEREPEAASQRHMAQRYRLKMMHQVASQVLQCRKTMSINFMESLGSPRGLGCTPRTDQHELEPAAPMRDVWFMSPA